MSVFGTEVDSALYQLTSRLEGIPELQDVLSKVRAGTLTELEAMQELMWVLASNPEIAQQIEALSTEMLAPLQDPHTVLADKPDPPDILLPPRREGGMPRMNPMYEAALQERVSFDGDAPELRTGPIPQGATPAVPVKSDAHDPVALGWMLEAAAEQVAKEIWAIEQQGADEVYQLLEQPPGTDIATREAGVLAKLDRANLPDPVGYERGQMPVARQVETPSGEALATLTKEQRGQLAWKFLSTTQGRRSAMGSLREMIWTKLRSDGHAVVFGDDVPGHVKADDILAYAEWVVDLSGPNATQSSFAFIDTAAHVLTKKLEESVVEGDAIGARLEVTALNMVDTRKVGWAARLLRSVIP